MIKIITLVLCLSFASMSFGMDTSGKFSGVGLANYSCGKFTSAVDKANNDQDLENWKEYTNYTAGVITGLNLGLNNTANILGSTDMDGAMAVINEHCRENPLDKYSQALIVLLLELSPNRTKTAP